MGETRKLAAILVADVVGYSRLAAADEDRTLARLRGLRSDLIDPAIAAHHGRIVKRTGDGSLIEFRSVVDAVRCAIEVQNGMVERNAGRAAGAPHRVSRRHSSGRRRRGGRRRSDGRWRQYRRASGRHRQARRDLPLRERLLAGQGTAGSRSRSILARLNSRTSSSRSGSIRLSGRSAREIRARPCAGKIRPAAPLDGRLAVREHRRRSRAGAFRRRGHGGLRPTSHGDEEPSSSPATPRLRTRESRST